MWENNQSAVQKKKREKEKQNLIGNVGDGIDWERGGWDRLWQLLNWFPESLTHLAFNKYHLRENSFELNLQMISAVLCEKWIKMIIHE